MHRFLWDMRWQPLPGGGGRGGGLGMAAIAHNTAPSPNSIWVAPGNYMVRLTADGKALTQPITVRMDPRVKTPAAGLAKLNELSLALYNGILDAQAALQKLRDLRAQAKKAGGTVPPGGDSPSSKAAQALAEFDKKASAIEGGAGGAGGRGGAGAGAPTPGPPMGMGGPGGGAGVPDSLSGIGGSLNQLMSMLQAADVPPTTQLAAAISERMKALSALFEKWNTLRTKDLATLNAALRAANLPEIKE